MKIGRFTLVELVEIWPHVLDFYKAFCTLDDAMRKKGYSSFETLKEELTNFTAAMRDKAVIKKSAPTKEETVAFDRASGGSG